MRKHKSLPTFHRKSNQISNKRRGQFFAVLLATTHLFTNVGNGYASEKTLWQERRKALARFPGNGTISKVFSPHQASVGPGEMLPSIRSLSGREQFDAPTSEFSFLPPQERRFMGEIAGAVAPYGEIGEIHFAGAQAPLVFHVQDIHDVEEAQRNMAGMVTALFKDGNVRVLGLEGASGQLSVAPFQRLPYPEAARSALDLALRLGYIGGAELAAFNFPNSRLWGVEDRALYQNNLVAFHRAQATRLEDQTWTDRFLVQSQSALTKWYNPSLKEFERQRDAYSQGDESLTDWAPYLWSLRPAHMRFPQIEHLVEVLSLEKAISFDAVEDERRQLIERLTKTLPADDIQGLINQSLAQRAGRLSMAKYYQFLQAVCDKHKIRMGPALVAYVDYLIKADRLRPSLLMDELAAIEEAVEQRLAVSPEEHQIANARRQLLALSKLIRHQMTPADWRWYESRGSALFASAETVSRLSGQDGAIGALKGIENYENYARCALDRNDAMVHNLLSKMKVENVTKGIVVAGGFHSEGMLRALKRAGASYVLLSPRISRVPRETNVLETIVRNPLPIEKLLRGQTIQLATPRLTGSQLDGSGVKSIDTALEAQRHSLGQLVAGATAVAAAQTGHELNAHDLAPLLEAGYLSAVTGVTPVALPKTVQSKVHALRLNQNNAEYILVWAKSDDIATDKNLLSAAGVEGDPVETETLKIGEENFTVFYFNVDQVVQRGWLGKKIQGLLRWIKDRLRGMGDYWDRSSGRGGILQRISKILVPVLIPAYVVPPSPGTAVVQGAPKKLADIFPSTPDQWTSVQKEALQFVLVSLALRENGAQFVQDSSDARGLVFALASPVAGSSLAQNVRFTLQTQPLPNGELFAVSPSRGPPEIALSADLFGADRSSLKRNISAVVRKALVEAGVTGFSNPKEEAYEEAQRVVQNFSRQTPTWLEQNEPVMAHVTLFSRSMESIFNRTLAEQLSARYGFDLLRYLSQTNFTGGLGHVTYDYHESLGQDGADVGSIFPLWNGIKGVVKHPAGRDMVMGSLPLPVRPDGRGYENMGDLLREVMTKTNLSLSSYRLPENSAFWDWVTRGAAGPESPFRDQCQKTLRLRGKDVQFDVFAVKGKYSGQPIFYLDAYIQEGDRKVRVFDELYGDPPDAPWRAVQVLVYSQASQRLMENLMQAGFAQSRMVTLDHEVFAQFPDTYLFWQGVKGRLVHMIHAFNHTVFRPGLWNAPKPVAGLLGLDNRQDLEEWGVSVARAANERAGAVTGVSRIHWWVLLKNLFGMEAPKVVDRFDPLRPDRGLSSTNGVLLDHWQGVEVRRLIDLTKEKLDLPFATDDDVFFRVLEQSSHRSQRADFQKRFEFIKSFYALELLMFLHHTQTQPQGGGHWLEESLGDVVGSDRGKFNLQNIHTFHSRWRFLLDRGFESDGDTAWQTMESELGALKEALLKRPIVANVRRQVSYKGPDMYKDILGFDKESFQNSNVRLIFGGRTFGDDARGLFDYAKSLGKDVGSLAFLENYNSEDAPLIFRGATASVMLSNENVEAAATSNSKIVVNGGWLISVFDGASPERLAVLEKRSGTIKLAIGYTHDELRAGVKSGALEILNGALIEFDDTSRSLTDGKGAGRRPSRSGLLKCFSELGTAYGSPDARRNILYRALRWSYTADIHRQTRAFLDIESDIVQNRVAVDDVARDILKSAELPILLQQLRSVLYEKGPTGFVWRHRHNRIIPSDVNGVGHEAGWAGFLAGFRDVKSRYYYQGEGVVAGDKDGQGLWSFQHHVMAENNNNELMDYIHWLIKDFPALAPLQEHLQQFDEQLHSMDRDVRVAETLRAIEFVQQTMARVQEEIYRRDMETGAHAVRQASWSKVEIDSLHNQNYSYEWRISVSPAEPWRDFNYMHSGSGLNDLRDALKLLLLEGSQGQESIKQTSYGTVRGGYFFSFLGTRWAEIPALRTIAFDLADRLEKIKLQGGTDGWSNSAVQWDIRRLYVELLGVLDALENVQPNDVPRPGQGSGTSAGPVDTLDQTLLGGPAGPVSIFQINVDVQTLREQCQAHHDQVVQAKTAMTALLGTWDVADGSRLSESKVIRAGQMLRERLQLNGDEADRHNHVSQYVWTALESLGEYLENAGLQEWDRWIALLAQGVNDHVADASDRIADSINQKRPIVMEITETMLDGRLTSEDKTRMDQLDRMAARSSELKADQVTWVLPNGVSSLGSFWAAHPNFAPLQRLNAPSVGKTEFMEGAKHSVKKLLLAAQKETRVDRLRPSDLYLANRSEWNVEKDLPTNVVRLLIALAGGLVYDATEAVDAQLRQLLYIKTNA